MNKEYKKNKTRFSICLVVFAMTAVSWLISMICIEGAQNNPFVQLIHIMIVYFSVFVGMNSFGNMRKHKMMVFCPEVYKFYPNDKSMLSLNEVLGKMHDTFLIKLFWGILLLMCFAFFVSMNVIQIIYKNMKIIEVIGANLILILISLVISGFFLLLLRTTKNNEAKHTLDKNSRNYMNVGTEDFLGVIQQDLYKGIRFRSKRLILTEQFIIGTTDNNILIPVAIPICLVQNIKHELRYYGGSSGSRYMELKFHCKLSNGNTVVLCVNQGECDIYLQMFKYYGLPIS